MEKDWCIIESEETNKENKELLKKLDLLECSLLNCWKTVSKCSEDHFNIQNEMNQLKLLIQNQNNTIYSLQKELEHWKQHDARMKNQMIRTKQPFSFRPETVITDITFT